MNVLIPILGVAFAAVSVWLSVRIINRGERWAKWTALALAVVMAGFPLSFGPVCWWFLEADYVQSNGQAVTREPTVYEPIGWLRRHISGRLAAVFDAYVTLGMREGDIIHIPDTEGGVGWMRR